MVRRTLNIKVLLATVLILAVIAGGLAGLHAWQVRRTAGVFLVRAAAQEKDSSWIEAATSIDRYLLLRPGDNGARVRLALNLSKGAQTLAQKQRAIDLCFRAIVAGVSGREAELRERLCTLLLETGRYSEADREARLLLSAGGKTEAAAARVLALSLWGQWKDGSLAAYRLEELDLVEQIGLARRLNPQDIDLAFVEAEMYRKHARLAMAKDSELTAAKCAAMADRALNELIAASPENHRAHLARYSYRTEHKLPEAEEDLQSALRLAPDRPDVLLVAGGHAYRQAMRQKGEDSASADTGKVLLEEAVDHYQKAIEKLESKDLRLSGAYLALGESKLALGQIDEALSAWRKGAEQEGQPAAQARLLGRVADTLLSADRLGEAEPVLRQLDDILNRLGTRVSGAELVALNRGQNLRRAFYQVKSGRGAEALGMLRSAISAQGDGASNDHADVTAHRLLGDACAAAGQWLEAAAAYDRAANLRPSDQALRMATANAWLMAGRPALAADQVERVLASEPTNTAWLLLATAEFRRQALLAPSEQSWTRFEQALRELDQRPADPPFPGAWRIALLRADYEVLRGRQSGLEPQVIARVADRLRRLEPEFLGQPDCALQWVLFYEHIGLTAEADRALASLGTFDLPAEKIAHVEARLAARRREYQRAAEILDAALKGAPADQQRRLREEAVEIAVAAEDFARAETILRLEHQQQPQDVEILRQLCELELTRGNPAGLKTWEEPLTKAGPWGEPLAHLFRGYRLLLTAKANDRGQLHQALEEHSQVLATRPEWGEAHVLGGMIQRRLGRLEAAVTAYQQAIDLGVHRVGVYEDLIELLDRLNRPADCNRYLARLVSVLPVSQRLTQLAGVQLLRRDDPQQAVEIARTRVQKQPEDPLARLWLGRVLLLANQPARAQQEFERAVQLAPDDARVWNGLFAFFVQNGDKAEARRTLQQLGQRARLEPSQRSYTLAQGYELLGDYDKAQQHYEEAVAAAPASVEIHLKMAGLYLRRDLKRAESSLRQALAMDPASAAARRMLAMVLASQGGSENLREAESLVANLDRSRLAVEDRRLHALVLLARRDEESLKRAIQIMDQVAGQAASPAEDRLILAELYHRLSVRELDPDKAAAHRQSAEKQLLTIASGAKVQPAHVATLVDFLLQRDPVHGNPSPQRLAEAGVWLDKLEDVISDKALGDRDAIERMVRLRMRHGSLDRCAPWVERLEASENDPLRTLALRADLLAARGKSSEAESLIEASADNLLAAAADKGEQQQIVQALAGLLERSGNHAAAERWYRKLYQVDQGQYAPLAISLARQGKLDEALALCEEAAAREVAFQPVVMMAAVLAESAPGPEPFQRVERALLQALEEFPSEPELLYSASVFRLLQERYDEAAELLERTLQLRPDDVRALNNLAMVLAEDPQQLAAARSTIDKAIALAGLDPGLLDTKGTILVYQGQAPEAIPLLERARNLEADPRYRFHLAVAYLDAGKIELAKAELAQALKDKLETQILTPTDRRLLVSVRKLVESEGEKHSAP